MDNPFNIVLIVLAVAIFVLFIIIRNKKDRRKLEENLNQDYKKAKNQEGDSETDLKAD